MIASGKYCLSPLAEDEGSPEEEMDGSWVVSECHHAGSDEVVVNNITMLRRVSLILTTLLTVPSETS